MGIYKACITNASARKCFFEIIGKVCDGVIVSHFKWDYNVC